MNQVLFYTHLCVSRILSAVYIVSERCRGLWLEKLICKITSYGVWFAQKPILSENAVIMSENAVDTVKQLHDEEFRAMFFCKF